jgi:hypothetical protein
MGAALTYARRYALFTLVGIAGEDDLDAPDLALQKVEPNPKNGPPIKESASNGHGVPSPAKPFQGPRTGTNGKSSPILSKETSAALRDQILAELESLKPQENLDAWILRTWPKANSLAPADGDRVRIAFQARLVRLQAIPENEDLTEAALSPTVNDARRSRIDKSVLALPEPKRLRNKQHLRFVAKQPCLVCGREPSDPHHLRFAQSRGLGLKVSDEFTVPLCRAHHRELHRAGKEVDWWMRIGIEPIDFARNLWLETHPLAISASHPDGDGAAAETKLATNGNEPTAIPNRRPTETTKRTQLPGRPT